MAAAPAPPSRKPDRRRRAGRRARARTPRPRSTRRPPPFPCPAAPPSPSSPGARSSSPARRSPTSPGCSHGHARRRRRAAPPRSPPPGCGPSPRAADPVRPARPRMLDAPPLPRDGAGLRPLRPDGRSAMCSTAAVQVCVDAGEAAAVAAPLGRGARASGPVLLAAFANSPRLHGRRTGWKSSRWAAGCGPTRRARAPPPRRPRPAPTRPRPGPGACCDSPGAVRARGAAAGWCPSGLTFADWIARGLPEPRPPPPTSTTTCPRCSRRSARTATWRSATSTPSPGGGGRCPPRCSRRCCPTPACIDRAREACEPAAGPLGLRGPPRARPTAVLARAAGQRVRAGLRAPARRSAPPDWVVDDLDRHDRATGAARALSRRRPDRRRARRARPLTQ